MASLSQLKYELQTDKELIALNGDGNQSKYIYQFFFINIIVFSDNFVNNENGKSATIMCKTNCIYITRIFKR